MADPVVIRGLLKNCFCFLCYPMGCSRQEAGHLVNQSEPDLIWELVSSKTFGVGLTFDLNLRLSQPLPSIEALATNLYVSIGGGLLAYTCGLLQSVEPRLSHFFVALRHRYRRLSR